MSTGQKAINTLLQIDDLLQRQRQLRLNAWRQALVENAHLLPALEDLVQAAEDIQAK